MNFNLVRHLKQQPPCAVSMERAIVDKERHLIASEAVLRHAMMRSTPSVQKQLLDAVWPSIQAIETSLLAMRDEAAKAAAGMWRGAA